LFLVGMGPPGGVFFGDGAAPHERLPRPVNVAVVDGPPKGRPDRPTTAVKASA